MRIEIKETLIGEFIVDLADGQIVLTPNKRNKETKKKQVMSKYVISINYGEVENDAGDDYEAAYRAYGKACDDYPNTTVTLVEDEEMIKEREIAE